MPRSKCLAPPPTRRPPRPLGTQSGQGTPTLVSVYRSSSPRTLQAREMGPQGGRAGCPETQAGAMRRPLHFCQCLTSWRPTLGYPTAGGYPLCTLTLLMMWGPAQGPRRLVEVHWDPRWEGSGGDGVTGRGPYPNPSSAAPTWGPILDGPLWEGMLGVLRSLNLQRPLLPGHPSWPHHTWHCHVPSLRRPWAITPAEPPGPGPTHLPPSLGHL